MEIIINTEHVFFVALFKAGRDMKEEGIQESPETVQYT